MKQLFRFLFIVPLLFLAFQIVWHVSNQSNYKMIPQKSDNRNQLFSLLKTADIKPVQTVIKSHSQEAEFYIKSSSQKYTKVVLSTQKNPYAQVNALQKLLKIANIKGKDIHFIDLSSSRPYATF